MKSATVGLPADVQAALERAAVRAAERLYGGRWTISKGEKGRSAE